MLSAAAASRLPEVAAASSPAPAGLPALDDLVEALYEVASAAALLLRADGAGLMLADQAGQLRWVTATGDAEQAFERAQRDLGEGPCVDAFGSGEAVRTIDLRADPRWPRLAPAATGNHIRGVLAAPVGLAGGVLGTINAVTHQPRAWTDDDAGAITTLAAVTGRLLGSTNEARHRGDMEREACPRRPPSSGCGAGPGPGRGGSTTWPRGHRQPGPAPAVGGAAAQSPSTWRSAGPT
jgi:signal transduction protein with GAF and PtsI domain